MRTVVVLVGLISAWSGQCGGVPPAGAGDAVAVTLSGEALGLRCTTGADCFGGFCEPGIN